MRSPERAHSAGSVRAGARFLVLCGIILIVLLFALMDCGSNAGAPGPQPQDQAGGFPYGMVSINFDDGKLTAFNNAVPILDRAGLKSTHYIDTGFFSSPGYVGSAEVLDLQSRGHEIGSHTRSHPDLTKVSPDRLATELAGSRGDLLNIGITAQTFAYPYGYYNDAVVTAVQSAGYIGARSSHGGANGPNQDRYQLKCMTILSTTAEADVRNWIDSAIANKTWLVLLFHDVDATGTTYSVAPQFFQHVVDYVVQKQVPVVTMSQALQAMQRASGIIYELPSAGIDLPNADLVITAGDWVDFTGSGAAPDGAQPLTYRWTFGAGSGIADSSAQNPGVVQFNSSGVYTVEFTVTDAQVATATATRIITVLLAGGGPIPNNDWKLQCVDSQQFGNEAPKGFDGSANTMWFTQWTPTSTPLPHEIQIDLGAAFDLTGFQYLPRQDSSWGRIGKYEFYVSSNGANWGTPVATGTFANDALLKEVHFPSIQARYIRLRALSSLAGSPFSSLAELSVIGRSSAASLSATVNPTQGACLNPREEKRARAQHIVATMRQRPLRQLDRVTRPRMRRSKFTCVMGGSCRAVTIVLAALAIIRCP